MTAPIAFVFPGQGSHRADMASAWLPAAQDLFDELSDASGLDLVTIADDAAACAASTRLGQPAITAVSLVALAALRDAGLRPDVVAGHSLGEVAAAVAAEVLTPTEGIGVVAARGRAMGRACRATPGAMAAVVRLPAATVADVVDGVEDVVIANVNAAQQVVIAGPPDAVGVASERLREAGGRALPLPVEGAFHSPAMTPAVVALGTALSWTTPQPPAVPVIAGLDGRLRTTAGEVTGALLDGLLAPVLWVDVEERLARSGVRLVVEVGPGGVLGGLLRRSQPDVRVVSVAAPDDVATAVEAVADLDRVPATV